jgi:hypothetical protein
VGNVARNLQARTVDKLGGEILSDVDKSFIFSTYKDLWKTDKQRKNMIAQGVDATQRQGANKKAIIIDQFKKMHHSTHLLSIRTLYERLLSMTRNM